MYGREKDYRNTMKTDWWKDNMAPMPMTYLRLFRRYECAIKALLSCNLDGTQ